MLTCSREERKKVPRKSSSSKIGAYITFTQYCYDILKMKGFDPLFPAINNVSRKQYCVRYERFHDWPKVDS
jgi:hypothetical protein